MVAGRDVDERRHEARVQLVVACRGARYARDAQCARAIEGLAAEHQPEVSPRHLDGALRLSRGLVATQQLAGAIARVAIAIEPGHVVPTIPVFRNAEVDVEPFLVRGERALEWPR